MKYLFILFLFYSCGDSSAQKVVNNWKIKAAESFQYVKRNNMDTTICILVDMRIPSGKNRMFVYDFQLASFVLKGLCTHGAGKEDFTYKPLDGSPAFSNVVDSHCTSLGKYKIGARGYSSWGIHVNYKLHGLEATNNNAFKRVVVLHSWEHVSNTEVHPNQSPLSWGCPAVSNEMMEELDALLKTKKKPVLLWIYY